VRAGERDDAPVVLPGPLEQQSQQLAPFGWVSLGVPELAEVPEQFFGLRQARIVGRL